MINTYARVSRDEAHLSLVMRKPVFGVFDQVHTNRAVQPQNMARGLKFRIKEEDGLYYLCSENKCADQLCDYRTADLRLFFAYASRFSHDAAPLKIGQLVWYDSCFCLGYVSSFYHTNKKRNYSMNH